MKMKLSSLFAYLFYILSGVMYGFMYTPLVIEGIGHDILLYSSVLCGIMAIILDGWRLKSFRRMVLIMGISVAVFLCSHETIFMIMIWAALMVKSTGYKNAFKTIFAVRIVTFCTVIVAVFLNVIPLEQFTVFKGVYGAEIAYSIGYNHPNNLGQEVFFLCTLYFCIKNDKLKLTNILAVLSIDVITYYITKSKTACGILFIICMILMFTIVDRKRKLFIWKLLDKGYSALSIIVPALGVGLPILFLNCSGSVQRIVWWLNGRLNGRISHASTLFLSFPLTVFGKIIDLEWVKNTFGYNAIDNGYVYALFDFGIVGFGLIVVLYFLTIRKLVDRKEYIYSTVVMGVLIFAVMENILRAMFMNFCMLFWWEVLNYNKIERKKKSDT